jgi:hypothetical protein
LSTASFGSGAGSSAGGSVDGCEGGDVEGDSEVCSGTFDGEVSSAGAAQERNDIITITITMSVNENDSFTGFLINDTLRFLILTMPGPNIY